MPRKRYRAEEVTRKLRETEVALAQGKSTAEVCEQLGAAEQTSYRWRREYDGLKIDQAKSSTSLRRSRLDSNDFLRKPNWTDNFEEGRLGKLLSPAKRRRWVEQVRDALGRKKVAERRTCRIPLPEQIGAFTLHSASQAERSP